MPPYSTPREQALLDEIAGLVRRDIWIWDRPLTLRHFLAGGGDEAAFPAHWQRVMDLNRRFTEAVAAQTYQIGGGSLFYLVAGQKPVPSV